LGWFGCVAVGRGFVAVIWCVWFWVLAVLTWEVSGTGAVVCDCLIIGGIQVESVVDSGRGACVWEDLKGKTVSTNLTCLETKIFIVDGS